MKRIKFVSKIKILAFEIVLDTILYIKINRTDIFETSLTQYAQRVIINHNNKFNTLDLNKEFLETNYPRG
ncbi:hypothetical protein GCM10022395_36750 [Snuella lapsa]|uniref:Uncharacterized protein n=1 Tax=Snuella lapsa TaxID=870481 RepID=A0ABP6YKC1_9FLAO